MNIRQQYNEKGISKARQLLQSIDDQQKESQTPFFANNLELAVTTNQHQNDSTQVPHDEFYVATQKFNPQLALKSIKPKDGLQGRAQIKSQLLGKDLPDKTLQELSLDYLQALGNSVKQQLRNTVISCRKHYSKSPQVIKSSQGSFKIRIHKLSYDHEVQKNENRDSNPERLWSILSNKEIEQKQRSSSILKLQSCALIEETQKSHSRNFESSQSQFTSFMSVQSHGSSDQNFTDCIKKANLRIPRCGNLPLASADQGEETQSNSPNSISSLQRCLNSDKRATTNSRVHYFKRLNTNKGRQDDAKLQQDFRFCRISAGKFKNLENIPSIILPIVGTNANSKLETTKESSNFKAIRQNLLSLVKDLECEKRISSVNQVPKPVVQTQERVSQFKIHLKMAK